MTWINSMLIVFSMYSRLPVRGVEWNDKNMKYSLGFFPLVGVVIGAFLTLWWWISEKLGFGIYFRSAIYCVIPVMITGGIHIDGFLDTVDALSSYQPKEKKLEIMKDPHTGAFAIIGCVMYYLVYFGALTEIKNLRISLIISIGFVLSRAFSGLSLVLFKSAKKEGLLYTFSSSAHRKITGIMLVSIILLCVAAMIFLNAVTGVILLVAAVLVFIYYRQMSYKQFGGITGDLAGFFLQVCELVILITTIVIDKL